jgi:hypothetical protein
MHTLLQFSEDSCHCIWRGVDDGRRDDVQATRSTKCPLNDGVQAQDEQVVNAECGDS